MRAVVTGGRHYRDRAQIGAVLDALLVEAGGDLEMAQGGATGADKLAREWCRANGVRCVTYAARWSDFGVARVLIRHDRYGRPYNALAGSQRNERMLCDFRPSVVIALTGGHGTANCVALARSWRRLGLDPIDVREIAAAA